MKSNSFLDKINYFFIIYYINNLIYIHNINIIFILIIFKKAF
jgi:hypothetical protein